MPIRGNHERFGLAWDIWNWFSFLDSLFLVRLIWVKVFDGFVNDESTLHVKELCFPLSPSCDVRVADVLTNLMILEGQILNLKMFEQEVAHKEDLNCMTSLQSFLDLLEFLLSFKPKLNCDHLKKKEKPKVLSNFYH